MLANKPIHGSTVLLRGVAGYTCGVWARCLSATAWLDWLPVLIYSIKIGPIRLVGRFEEQPAF